MTLCRTDTLPAFDELNAMGEAIPFPALLCVLDTAGGDLPTFRRFLSLEAPENLPTGLYKPL